MDFNEENHDDQEVVKEVEEGFFLLVLVIDLDLDKLIAKVDLSSFLRISLGSILMLSGD